MGTFNEKHFGTSEQQQTSIDNMINTGETIIQRLKPNKKAYPSPVGMPFVFCGYIRKICGYFLAGTPNSTPFFRSAAHLQPVPEPFLLPCLT